jgi:hypothetical protein
MTDFVTIKMFYGFRIKGGFIDILKNCLPELNALRTEAGSHYVMNK